MKKSILFLSLVIVLVAGLLVGGCQAAPTEEATKGPTKEEPILLKFATYDPDFCPYDRCFVQPWIARIESDTGGRVQIDYYGVESLVKRQDLHDALLTGIADITKTGPTLMPGRMPLTELADLPFLYKSSLITGLTVQEAFDTGLYGNEWKDVKMIAWLPNAPSIIRHRTKFIKTAEDWKGQKFNGAGTTYSEIARLMGATNVALVVGEVTDSLSKGLIDFSMGEWAQIWTFKRYEVTKYTTADCNIAISAGGHYAMSWDTYNKLPKDIQAIVDKYSGPEMTKLMSANFGREEALQKQWTLEYDKKVGNPEPYKLPNDERNRWIEKITPMYETFITQREAKGLPARVTFNKIREISAKYEAMYPPGSDAERGMFEKYGAGCLFPGYPKDYPGYTPGWQMPKK